MYNACLSYSTADIFSHIGLCPVFQTNLKGREGIGKVGKVGKVGMEGREGLIESACPSTVEFYNKFGHLFFHHFC